MATIDNTRTWNQAHIFSSHISLPKKRLDRWKVCKDFQNGNCENQENECEYAHPSSEKEIIEGIVTVCMDNVNHQCLRQNCKYFHPPTHICDQIHDHKKKPYSNRSRSMSFVESDQTPFASSQDYFSSYQLPYLYYQNAPQSAVYFPPYANTSLNLPGPVYGTPPSYQQSHISTSKQESGEEQNPIQESPSDHPPHQMYPLFIPPFYTPIITN